MLFQMESAEKRKNQMKKKEEAAECVYVHNEKVSESLIWTKREGARYFQKTKQPQDGFSPFDLKDW